MKSWKTTVFGSGGLLIIAAGAIAAFFDGDPTTEPNWTLVLGALGGAIALFFAKDKNVTGGTTPQ